MPCFEKGDLAGEKFRRTERKSRDGLKKENGNGIIAEMEKLARVTNDVIENLSYLGE